jgi:glucose/arabinose dehydrogenase
MRQGGFHQSRTLLIPKNFPNWLAVSRGSNDNVDAQTAQVGSGRSQIRAWDVTKLTGSAVDYSSTGTVVGWGLRNSVGVGENPIDGGIVS